MKIVDAIQEFDRPYARHLLVKELCLEPQKEWSPPPGGWTMVRIGGGTGYWLQGAARMELETGAVLLVAEPSRGRILASCLGPISLHFFTVMPERLTGLITQGEQDYFTRAAGRREFAQQIMPPESPAAMKMKELCSSTNRKGLMVRLNLLQLLVQSVGNGLEQTDADPLHADVKERLRAFLVETPPAALLEIGFDELARITHCTPRHLSRVFYDLVGMSFRDKRAEIRLARARELLATSQSKVVDVAFKSGYKSLSLFNRMFTRRFGISPGRWRLKNNNNKRVPDRRSSKSRPAINRTRLRAVA
jgi:AraC-like DNA-binding protein